MFERSLCVVLLLTVVSAAGAVDPKAKPPLGPTANETAFFDRLKAVETTLGKSKAFAVTAETKWKITGGKQEQSGVSTASMLAELPGKLRIRVGVGGQAEPQYAVACDGKSITRLFATADLYSITPCDGTPLDDVQTDGVTLFALRPTGVDFLFRPYLSASLAAQVLTVEALGDSGEGKAKRTSYRVAQASGRVLVFRFGEGADALPTEMVTTFEVTVGEKKKLIYTLDSTLTWDLSAKPGADDFKLALPKDVKKVDDLAEALFAPDVSDLIGKPAPETTFTGTDGKPLKLADLKGKPVVLYAWAIWAAPSTDSLPALAKFVTDYEAKGVHFLAVNVGDSPEAVKQFVAKAKFTGNVALDPLGSALGTLRAQTVPAVVVIDKDGKVVAYHRGRADTADKVKAELDKLLK